MGMTEEKKLSNIDTTDVWCICFHQRKQSYGCLSYCLPRDGVGYETVFDVHEIGTVKLKGG